MCDYKFAIVIPSILAAIVTSMRVLVDNGLIRHTDFQPVIFVSPAAPTLVICFAYCVIWWKRKIRMDNQNQQIQREKTLAKTLVLITGASLLTWLPFQIINILGSSTVGLIGVRIIKLLQFSNSIVNVIIYPFRIPEFKGALLTMLRGFVTAFSRKTNRHRAEDVKETAI